MALLFREKILFTGDHLWAEQTRSTERLLDYDFEWVLPGHGPSLHASPSRMRAALERLIARMKQ